MIFSAIAPNFILKAIQKAALTVRAYSVSVV